MIIHEDAGKQAVAERAGRRTRGDPGPEATSVPDTFFQDNLEYPPLLYPQSKR